MAIPKTAWGIDIGQCALKALKLRDVEGEMQVEAFDIIEHPKILSQPDANRQQLILNALEQFLARNNVSGSAVCISVPGQTSFTRFVKLPPVEPKKIPDIVKFEAEQQIPFPIEEVVWRWQTFHDPDSPDVEVGIFAMKRNDVSSMLDNFTELEVPVDCVQMAPLALYNFMMFDEQVAADGATLLADVGADKTDLVFSDGAKIWTRTIQIGGNNFTEALVKAFKLSFAKAEKLKRTAATSKYARQIFQAMRPVFADLVQEIQRSIGYYTSLNRDTQFKKLVGLGNGFRLPGLQKFLEQNLNIPVVRIDTYNRLSHSPTVSAPTFTENVLSFAVAYGLAAQGLEQTPILTSLLPNEIARKRLWDKKRIWFGGAVAAIILTMIIVGGRLSADIRTLPTDSPNLLSGQRIANEVTSLKRQNKNWDSQKDTVREKDIGKRMKHFGYRTFMPHVEAMVSRAISKVAIDQGYLNVESITSLTKKPRSQRLIIITKELILDEYHEDLSTVTLLADSNAATHAPAPGREGSQKQRKDIRRGFHVVIRGRTPLGVNTADSKIVTPLQNRLEELAREYDEFEIIEIKRDFTEAGAARDPHAARLPVRRTDASSEDGPLDPDPYFPSEDKSKDTHFVVAFKLAITGDGLGLSDKDSNKGR